ncbi:hypothetical protein AVEN_269787-1 [Araneus ventricosus]|uniref:Uncharacterized protein n=1 Tax=Araneus ventricosus TaxID=182803 RepID=A0A4Y2PCT4_ARAVE|nr:hypothetical protein AVEN_269787-1 [Araneus ventricosus]
MRSDLNAYRFLLLLAQGQSRIILPRAQIATSTHAHGESDEKEKRQAGVNNYGAQKIASSMHARGNSGFIGWLVGWLVGLEEGGGLITAGESSKSSDMLYSMASSSDDKEGQATHLSVCIRFPVMRFSLNGGGQ